MENTKTYTEFKEEQRQKFEALPIQYFLSENIETICKKMEVASPKDLIKIGGFGVMKKIEIEHGENARIIFNYFAIENDKLFLAFYEPIYYVDLDDYLNNTENIIEKLVEETEK
ncbi:hypothetical protein RP118_002744 [Staphylococcus pseudintermedius]|nr:hypothetical protein [Staphylococcus pseudintermedius]